MPLFLLLLLQYGTRWWCYIYSFLARHPPEFRSGTYFRKSACKKLSYWLPFNAFSTCSKFSIWFDNGPRCIFTWRLFNFLRGTFRKSWTSLNFCNHIDNLVTKWLTQIHKHRSSWVRVESYGAVPNYIFVIQHDVSGAIEVLQSFSCCLFYLPQIGYQQSGINYRLVFCEYICLKRFYNKLRSLIKKKMQIFVEINERNLVMWMHVRLVGSVQQLRGLIVWICEYWDHSAKKVSSE